MNKIFLIRHGQDVDNKNGILNGRRDKELTKIGRHQAKTVASKLKNYDIQVIYTSPSKRTHETARIIARELGIKETIVDKSLIERDFGVLTGKPVVDIPKYANKILVADGVNYFLDVEGAENFSVLYVRGKKILEKINRKHKNKNVLIVTHGDIGKMIQAAFHSWKWEGGLRTPYFKNMGILELSHKLDILR